MIKLIDDLKKPRLFERQTLTKLTLQQLSNELSESTQCLFTWDLDFDDRVRLMRKVRVLGQLVHERTERRYQDLLQLEDELEQSNKVALDEPCHSQISMHVLGEHRDFGEGHDT